MAARKRGNAPKAAVRRSLLTRQEAEIARLTRELHEAQEQHGATSEVLKVISSSPGELEPVFQTMLQNATRLCEAKFGTLYLSEDDGFRAVAFHNAPPAFAEERRRGAVKPGPDTALGRVWRTKNVLSSPTSGSSGRI